ncbi:hypothetical protein BAUCODRAFT_112939 [Baudoinia panamericana UAMH 10762]|uniref:BTB domain-containing protein n=1 Tax=Baudoinia panamericana (strain UAMH 10762) TaxID=717646 RepID=M2MRP3_BAUPA|nr:uncharacterized protein BAUCODRAFT_112939 [Baudoinia panamericana UAMH 10762]EMC94153.1 hypothetical protein BAUCODRAFT_112939 [Baudoinia panamericana UAMH 10762]
MGSDDQPPAKRRRMDLSKSILVLVGKEEKPFTVPRSFLTKSSEFFVTCLNGAWKEASSKEVKLPDIMPDIFEIYLQWLYTGELVYTDQDLNDMPGGDIILALAVYRALIRLAIAGDVLQDIPFRNAVVDATISVLPKIPILPSAGLINLAYENLPRAGGLIRLMVRDAAGSWIAQDTPCEEGPAKFLADVIGELRTAMRNGTILRDYVKLEERCTYHEHNDRVPKCETAKK